ncbi:MAG: hypothetical protein U1F76_02805 [Candidatus Competibacteraceae bacterium]
MKSLQGMQNSAVKHTLVWIICLAVFFPVVGYSEDQARSRLLGSAIQKAIKESDKKDNSPKDSSDNRSNQSQSSRSNQSYSSPGQDSYRSTNSDPPTSTDNQGRETPRSRLMGNTIKEVMTSDYSNQPPTPADNQGRETPRSRLIGNTIREVMTSAYPDRENRANHHHSNYDYNNYYYNYYQNPGPDRYYNYPYGIYYQGPSECSKQSTEFNSSYTCYPKAEITRSNIKEVAPPPASAIAAKTMGTLPSPDARRPSFNSHNFLEKQLTRIRDLLTGRWPGATTERPAVIKATENCDNPSGTIDLTYRDTDNDKKLSRGDSFIFNYRHCQDNALGITAYGQLMLQVKEVTGDAINNLSPYTFVGKFDFNELTIINNVTHQKSIIKGDVDFRLSTDLKVSR